MSRDGGVTPAGMRSYTARNTGVAQAQSMKHPVPGSFAAGTLLTYACHSCGQACNMTQKARGQEQPSCLATAPTWTGTFNMRKGVSHHLKAKAISSPGVVTRHKLAACSEVRVRAAAVMAIFTDLQGRSPRHSSRLKCRLACT
eukprot:1122102-Pelagomonas_calceolata.AAC.1